MSVLCGWASISEKGTKYGRAGDQTGKELKTGSWYQFGQKVVLRWKDEKLAEKYAKIIRTLCNNNHIGYDQNERTTLYNELKRLKWDYTKLTKNCETDCSALVGSAVNATIGKDLIPSYIYTGNLEYLLMNTGYFKKLTGSKYLTQSSFLKRGDILNRSGKHVISVLENGVNAGKPTANKVAEPPLYRGCTGSEVKKLQSNLNQFGFKLTLDGVFGANTKTALINWQRKYKLEPDGYYGAKSYQKMFELIK